MYSAWHSFTVFVRLHDLIKYKKYRSRFGSEKTVKQLNLCREQHAKLLLCTDADGRKLCFGNKDIGK